MRNTIKPDADLAKLIGLAPVYADLLPPERVPAPYVSTLQPSASATPCNPGPLHAIAYGLACALAAGSVAYAALAYANTPAPIHYPYAYSPSK